MTKRGFILIYYLISILLIKYFIKHQYYSGNSVLDLKMNLSASNTEFMDKVK